MTSAEIWTVVNRLDELTIHDVVVDGQVAAVRWSERAHAAGGADWVNHSVDVIHVRGGRFVALHENGDRCAVRRYFPRHAETGR